MSRSRETHTEETEADDSLFSAAFISLLKHIGLLIGNAIILEKGKTHEDEK